MINVIYRKDCDVFNTLLEGFIDFADKDHRKYSSFYVTALIEIDEECFPEEQFKPYYGTWLSNQFVWSDRDGGFSDIHELHRVETKTRTVTEEYWEKVKD